MHAMPFPGRARGLHLVALRRRELRLALGQAWDDELEPFRHAHDDTSVIWLHNVG